MKKIIIIYIAAFSILCLFKKTAICQNIGDNIHGGVVFYLNGNGGGLVALKTATAGAVNASWGCRGTIVNAGGTAIGTGYSNTVNILSGCTTPGIFADIISQLTHEGYSDWYMPSKDELQEIRDVFWGNGFNTYFAQSPNGHYDHITSSEASSETAWRLNCSNNVWEANWKDATNFGTIPIRGFGTMMPVMGCTDPTACNYNASANVDDGSCELPDGCTDSLACNYDPNAGCDDGSCTYLGCTDPLACNYDMLAGCDDGSCSYPATSVDGVWYLLDPNDYGGYTSWGLHYNMTFNEANGTVNWALMPSSCNGGYGYCPPDPFMYNTTYSYSFCGNTLIINNTTLTYDSILGIFTGDYLGTAVVMVPVPWETGCTDSTACNYNPNSNYDFNTTCTYTSGCMDSTAFNYNPNACIADNSCIPIVNGCTDPTACNYNASANVDDGSCELPDGCTNQNACNYDSLATCDNNTCIYPNTDSSSVIECDSYTWDGVVYTSSGAYTNVYTNIAGCDSTHTLNLTINNSNTGSTSATSCDSYTWDGVVYTLSGAYTNVYTNIAGCDSTHTLNLTINNSNTGSTSATSCDSYTWDGVTYISSGVYTNIYTNAAGCDSVHALNLTINRLSISDYNQLLILTEEHEDHGHMHTPTTEGYNEETNKLKTFDLNQNSILYYDPTELENIESTTYNVLNNKVYALSEHDDTTYIVSIDKNANLEIDFLSSWDNTLVEYIEIEAYKNHLYLISTYNDSITFEEQIIFSKYNINTKTLTQINVLDTVDHYESEGTTFSDYNSVMYTVYTDDEKGSLISIDTLGSYQVIYEADGYISAIEAVGEKIYMILQEGGGEMCAECYLELPDGNGGAKTWEITNSSGGNEFCGQELANAESNTFYFTINPGDSILDDFGSTYLYAGEYGPGTTDSLGSLYEVHCEDHGAHMHTPTTEGYSEETYSLYIYNTITDTIENIYLLDSTLSLEDPISTYSRIDKKMYVKTEDDDNQLVFSIDSLGQTQLVYIDSASGIEFIEAHTKTTPQLEICDNYSWNGGVYTTSGIYTWTGTNQDGCDSTATLNIHINNSTFSNSLAVSCDSYTFNDTIYTSTGTHIWKTTNSVGCDSTHTLNLIINKSDTTTSTETACDNYIWDGTTYTTTGLYTKSYTAFTGCDSTHTLNLIINKRDTTTSTETACDNYIWDGTTYTTSGVYTKDYTSVEGCDSAHILNLTINNSSFTSSSAVSCDGYTWNGSTYYNTGTYVWTTTNSTGCDSVATLNLIINQVYAEITQSGETLKASTSPPGLNVDWYNTQTESGSKRIWLMEEDTSTFNPIFDCSYFIVVNHEGCVDTSETYFYAANAARIGSFVASPNPTKGMVNVKFQNNNNQIVVFDLITNSGVKLDEFITIEDNQDIDLSKYPSGTYYLYFNSEEAIQGCRPEESQKTSTKIILNK